jgi:hypothetical protein
VNAGILIVRLLLFLPSDSSSLRAERVFFRRTAA